MKKLMITCVVIVMLFNISTSYAATFQGIGDLPGGGFETEVMGISGDGSVLVGLSEATFGTRAIKWDWSGGIMELSGFPFDTTQSTSSAVSYDSSVIIGDYRSYSSGSGGYRWEDNVIIELGSLVPGNSFSVSAMSNDGSIIVGHTQTSIGDERPFTNEAMRWENGTITSIGRLPGYNRSWANGISSDGNVIIGWAWSLIGSTDDIREVFRYESGVMTPMITNFPGDVIFGFPSAVSSDGSKVVGQVRESNVSALIPVMWTSPNTFVELGDLPGGSTDGRANDITPDGTVVVGNSNSFNGSDAFIWDEINGMMNLREVLIDDYGLDLSGWILSQAVAISDDGLTIAGNGRNPDNHNDGWVVNLSDSVPIPDSIVSTTISGVNIRVNKSELSFVIKGLFIGSDIDIEGGTLIVQIGAYQEIIEPNNPGITIKLGKSYQYKGSKGGITKAKFDYIKQTFMITGKGISSSTLDSPIDISVEI